MKKLLCFFTILTTLLVACTNDSVDAYADSLTGKPIQIKTNIVKLAKSRVNGNDNETDLNKFSLIIDGGTNGTNYYAMMVHEGSKWESYEPTSISEPPYTPLSMTWKNSNKVNVTAYYCEGSIYDQYKFSQQIGCTVLENQATSENYKKSDQLYMPPTEITPNEEGCITINFKHRFSKISVIINTNSSETENPIQNLYINGTASLRLYTPKTNTWGDIKEEDIKDITACFDSYENGMATYDAILIPQDIAAHKFKIKFIINNNTYEWDLQEAITFEENKHYTIELELKDNENASNNISISSINISTWDESTTTITGTILSK